MVQELLQLLTKFTQIQFRAGAKRLSFIADRLRHKDSRFAPVLKNASPRL